METLCAPIRRSDERMADIAFFNLPVRLAKTLPSYQPQGRGTMDNYSQARTTAWLIAPEPHAAATELQRYCDAEPGLRFARKVPAVTRLSM